MGHFPKLLFSKAFRMSKRVVSDASSLTHSAECPPSCISPFGMPATERSVFADSRHPKPFRYKTFRFPQEQSLRQDECTDAFYWGQFHIGQEGGLSGFTGFRFPISTSTGRHVRQVTRTIKIQGGFSTELFKRLLMLQ